MQDSMPVPAPDKAFGGALAGNERASRSSTSVVISVAAWASVRATIEGRNAADVGGEPGGDRVLIWAGRDQDLAAHVAALLLRGELVLEVDARGAGLDHRLHELEGVERAAEAGLGVGDDRARTSAARRVALGVLDLVGALQRVLIRRQSSGAALAGYRLWSGYISPAGLASAATCQPER